MANISSLLDTIKNAIYGRDMRSALHDAIKTVNEDTETIKTKLDTKVDKVSGKSLIDGGVADNLEYDTDKEEILIKVSKPSQGLRVKSTAFSESTQITSGSITIESDASGLGNYLSLSPFGGIMINTPTTSNADIRLATSKGTHRLSRKADQTDVDKKVDKIEGKTLIDKTVADFLSDYGGALQVKCGIFADGAIESYSEIIARGDITAKDGHDVIAYVQKEAGGSVVVHKLSEKIGLGTTVIGSTDKIRLESADNVGPSGIEINPHFSNDVGKAFIKLGVSPTSPAKTIVGTGSITGSDMENSFSISGNDIICSPNSKVTHRLSQKVDKVEGKALIDEKAANRISGTSTGDLKLDNNWLFNTATMEHTLPTTGETDLKFVVNTGLQLITENESGDFDIALIKGSKTHKLSEKVDKVDGKSLIDEKVADTLSYDSTTTSIVVSSISQGIEARNFIGVNAGISETGLISGQHLTIETDGADNVPGVVGIEAKNGDVTANVCIDPDSGAHKLHKLSQKANTSDVLTKTNTTEFTPMADYQPATKKYVDDAIKAAIEKYNTEAMALLGED